MDKAQTKKLFKIITAFCYGQKLWSAPFKRFPIFEELKHP